MPIDWRLNLTLINSPIFLGHLIHEVLCVAVVLRQTGLQQRLDHLPVDRFHGDGQRRPSVVQRLVQFRAELQAAYNITDDKQMITVNKKTLTGG